MKNKNKLKRIADMFEKFAVASMAIGVFKGVPEAVFVSIACGLASLFLTRED